jgi:MFS family permease
LLVVPFWGRESSASRSGPSRIVQGAAGGVLTPQISATIQQLFQGGARGGAFGAFASVAAVSSAIGPLAGGVLIAAFGTADGWRAVDRRRVTTRQGHFRS